MALALTLTSPIVLALTIPLAGDGKVEPWELEVFERIKAADADASGCINVKELFGVIKGAAESDRQKKRFRKLFIGATLFSFLMLFANMALTAAVVFLAKDTKLGPNGQMMVSGSGMPVSMENPSFTVKSAARPAISNVSSSNPDGDGAASLRRRLEVSLGVPPGSDTTKMFTDADGEPIRNVFYALRSNLRQTSTQAALKARSHPLCLCVARFRLTALPLRALWTGRCHRCR